MTLEQQVLVNAIKLITALDRIEALEKATAKLVAMETTRQLASKALCDFETLRDEASSQIGQDM